MIIFFFHEKVKIKSPPVHNSQRSFGDKFDRKGRLSHGFGCTDRRAMIFTASCRVNSPLSDAPQSPDSLPFVPSKSSIQILRKCPATQRGFAVATRHTRSKHLGSCARMTLEAIGQVDQSRCFHSITVANRVKSSQFYPNFL